jgi:hypothetical protein
MPSAKSVLSTVNGIEGKHCAVCELWKPLNDFNKGQGVGGRNAKCKECLNKIRRERHNQNKEIRNAQCREWKKNNKEKVSEYNKKYHAEHQEERLEYVRKYRDENREAVRTSLRNSRQKHKDRVQAYNKKYVAENLVKWREYELRKRTIKASLPHEVSTQEVISIYGNACLLTGSTDIQVDHFIPISWGHGGTYIGNVYPLDSLINNTKKARNPLDFFSELVDEGKISEEKFNSLVSHLAEQNNMSLEEFIDYVYWCEENKER